jgi:hypothetical protein
MGIRLDCMKTSFSPVQLHVRNRSESMAECGRHCQRAVAAKRAGAKASAAAQSITPRQHTMRIHAPTSAQHCAHRLQQRRPFTCAPSPPLVKIASKRQPWPRWRQKTHTANGLAKAPKYRPRATSQQWAKVPAVPARSTHQRLCAPPPARAAYPHHSTIALLV